MPNLTSSNSCRRADSGRQRSPQSHARVLHPPPSVTFKNLCRCRCHTHPREVCKGVYVCVVCLSVSVCRKTSGITVQKHLIGRFGDTGTTGAQSGKEAETAHNLMQRARLVLLPLLALHKPRLQAASVCVHVVSIRCLNCSSVFKPRGSGNTCHHTGVPYVSAYVSSKRGQFLILSVLSQESGLTWQRC